MTKADDDLPPKDAAALVKQAEEHYLAGEQDLALTCLDRAIRLEPDRVESYLVRGRLNYEHKAYAAAVEDFTEVLRRDPQTLDALRWRGATYAQLGRFREAIADFDEVLHSDPDDAKGYWNRGAARVYTEGHAAAVADYSRALELDSTLVAVHFFRGRSYFQLGAYEAAAADLNEAVRLNPEDLQSMRWRAFALTELGKYDAAIKDLDEVLVRSPGDATAFRYRGVAHSWLSEWEAAAADYSEAIRLNSKDARAYQYRGLVYYAWREYDKAEEDFTEAHCLDPKYADPLIWLGRLSRGDGNIPAAIEEFSKAIEVAPTNAEAYRRRAEAKVETGEYAEAVADYDQAIRLNPLDPEAYSGRAEAYEWLGHSVRARSDDETAERLQSEQSQQSEQTMTEKTRIYPLLQEHFAPLPLENLTITERKFPSRVRADLQRAINSLVETMTIRHFSGVRKQYTHNGTNFTELVVRERNDPPLAVPPQYEEIDIGEDLPLRCLKGGLWLLEHEGSRFAVFLEPRPTFRCGEDGIRFQVATADDENGHGITQTFFEHLERSVREARSYRGKILSLEVGERYSGASTGITVHKLRSVEREQVILPKQTLELLERNVIGFVRNRPRLAELGLATKKGLLFYGPPGTGKTHTIHFLAGALEGTTTLLISAEQVVLLGEYMKLARLLAPSLVVIEDADLIARDRGDMSDPYEEVLLNKLLNEMDGLKESADILFVLTTNRPEALEAALASRPGRVDQAIEFPYPDEEGRTKLVRLYSRGLDVPEEVVQETVRRTVNVSAAFIKELMRRAAQFQLERDGTGAMTQDDVTNALDELLFSGGSLNRKLLGGQFAEAELPSVDRHMEVVE